MRLSASLGLLAAVGAFAACGGSAGTSSSTSGTSTSSSSGSATSTSVSAGSGGSSSSSTASNSSSSSGSSGGGGAGGAPPAIYGGFVNLRMIQDATGITYVGTTMLSMGGQPSEVIYASCDGAQEVSGDCCYRSTANGPGSPLVEVDAGTLTITNKTTGATLGTMDYQAAYQFYGPATWKTPAWAAGDMITVSAPGATTDAFQLTIGAPTPILGTPPSWASPMMIPRSTAFHASWTPNGVAGEKAVLVLTGGKPNAPHGIVVCEVPDAQGAVDVDPALLGHFETDDACQPCMLQRLSATKAQFGQTAVALRSYIESLILGAFH